MSTWFKAVGDEVAENEPLLEISTDKVNMEVAAPASGRLMEILKQDGEQIELGMFLDGLRLAHRLMFRQRAALTYHRPARHRRTARRRRDVIL